MIASVIHAKAVVQITDTACPTPHDNYVIVAGQPYGDSFSSKEKPDKFSNMPKLFPRSERLTSLQLLKLSPFSLFPNMGIIFALQI